MKKKPSHLVINWIVIENKVVRIGATDYERWIEDIDCGMSGDDAKTIVYVTLTDNGKGISVSEDASLHCLPGDPNRNIAISGVNKLFDIAWIIKNEKINYLDARKLYFGKEINQVN